MKEIKKLVYRYMSLHNTNRYIDRLQDLVQTYNMTYHKSIGMAPADVTNKTLGMVLHTLYGKLWARDTYLDHNTTLQPGVFVRISMARHPFSKSYKGTWSTELYKVDSVKLYSPRRMYRLTDKDGEIVEGLFYEDELQLVSPASERYTHVERVLRRKSIKGRKWVLIKWRGESQPSWVQESSLGT